MERKLEAGCVAAVIVAAGRGRRMGSGVPKQFLPLAGVPVLCRTVEAFLRCAAVGAVVAVVPADAVGRARALLGGLNARPECPVRVVSGGATRQRSAAAGFAALPEGARFVAVHDGARPLITPAQIEAVAGAAALTGAAAAAAPVKDTVKVADADGFVVSTPDRRTLWAVQTPQIFERTLYARALRRAQALGEEYTDDCQLVERAGGRVRLVDCGYRNLKITTPEDLLTAEALLGRKARP